MTMRADPRDVIPLHERRTDLIDAGDNAGCGIEPRDHVVANRGFRPRLSAHLANGDAAQHAKVLERAVPLADRTLPFTNRDVLLSAAEGERRIHVVAHRGRE